VSSPDIEGYRGGFDGARCGALLRPRLLLAVQGRWERRVTAVVAGAGFGKTTLLAQAVAESRLARAGVDVSLGLEPAHESAARLGRALLRRLGADRAPRHEVEDLVGQVVDAVWARAPEPVCLVLDDVHGLAPGSEGVELLRRLVEALPANAHLLLGSRTFPEVGVARLAVAGDALVLRDADLAFADDEVAEFAAVRGVPPEQLLAARGWPALAELLARATGVTPDEYVREQVVGPLDAARRARLIEVAALGGADDDLASAVAEVPVRLEEVMVDLPLVRRTEAGWWELHDVLAEPIVAREAPDRVASIRRRGGLHARRAGDVDRGLRLLVAAGAWPDVVATVRSTFVELGAPEDPSRARSWAELLPPGLQSEPEVLLLRTVAESVDSPEQAYAVGERAVAAFAARADVEGEVAALARLGAIAYALVDIELIAPYLERVAELARTGHPWAVAFDAVCRGVLAGMLGHWREAEAILRPVAADPGSDPSQGLAAYFCARAQLERGRTREAALTLDRMPEAHRRRVRDGVLGIEVAIAQATGTVDEALDEIRGAARRADGPRPIVARRIALAWLASAHALMGDAPAARRCLRDLEDLGGPTGATLDEELLATATLAIAEGDEDAAADLLARVPSRGTRVPPRDGSVLYYVLRPELRAAYDALDIEGVLAQRRAFARLLVAGREGDFAPAGRFAWPREAVLRWFAPPPWLVEAAVYSVAGGAAAPAEVLAGHDRTARDVLAGMSTSSDARVADAAVRILAPLPPAPPEPIAIRLLGPLELDVAGERSTAPELRRERVRSLLGLLVLRRPVRRLELAAVLWPELAEDQALGNLRVTLNHLLRLIEPGRARNAPSYFVHQEHDSLTLVGEPAISVDVWEFEAAAVEADRLDGSGAPSLALVEYSRAVRLWRGEVLADLGGADWLGFDRLRLGTTFVRGALRAGELLAARREYGPAIVMAERVIAADPWAEAGYRLLAAAHLDRGDPAAARRVLDHLDRVLGELGVAPDAATRTLRRRSLEAG
jgi:DNA-binding SARP family transcriptional activator